MYNIIPISGCNNICWKICDKINIPYKIIYDADVIVSYFNEYKNNKIQNIIGNRYNDEFTTASQEKTITCETILTIFDDINFSSLENIHLHVFKNTMNVLLTNDKLPSHNIVSKEIGNAHSSLAFTKGNRVGKQKAQQLHDDIQNNNNETHTANTISLFEFCNKYNEIWDIEIEKLDTGHFKHKPTKFTARMHIHLSKIKNSANLNEFYDKVINEKLKKNDVFVWNIDVFDLEGAMGKITGDEFDKKNWKNISDEEIKKSISNKNDNTMNELLSFLNN